MHIVIPNQPGALHLLDQAKIRLISCNMNLAYNYWFLFCL